MCDPIRTGHAHLGIGDLVDSSSTLLSINQSHGHRGSLRKWLLLVPAAMIRVHLVKYRRLRTFGEIEHSSLLSTTDFMKGKNTLGLLGFPGASYFPPGIHNLELLAQSFCSQLSRKILTSISQFPLKAKRSVPTTVSTF